MPGRYSCSRSNSLSAFSRERSSQIYGWLFSANIPAAVSPIVAGMVFDGLGRFSPVLWCIGGLMGCGALVLGWGVRLDVK